MSVPLRKDDDVALLEALRLFTHGGGPATAIVSLIGLLALAAAGCNAPPSETDEDVATAEQALNCAASCVQVYNVCVLYDELESCVAERDECMQRCAEGTCEPGTPGCCLPGDDGCF